MNREMQSPFEAIGGGKVVERLVKTFYSRVRVHPDLAPLFPDDLTETMRKQTQFLTQFLGGPSLYSHEHGHPRLRARHLRFPISQIQANAWLDCMSKALNDVIIDSEWRERLLERFTLTAHHMINQPASKDDI
ncbi:globin [Terrilactibacillus sp. BCM23-1]|uniref:Globin n=1 Tax=Terrilactibacillus tamarindi TaxID=2599694 RepID=A0A6N8CN14_9BACI|nr:globin [Terrilactibacillus tamarindi]MTT30577.1 globin [Terrilactibacillus tamarindi]